jgi:hypothetical protein
MFLLETGDTGVRVVPVAGREDEVRAVGAALSLPLNQPIVFYVDGDNKVMSNPFTK